MSALEEKMLAADRARAEHYAKEARECFRQAVDLTAMADELVTQAYQLPDANPKRRALLNMATCMRQGANGFTDAGETFDSWAADLLVHAETRAAS
jgi:hypothetical protein